MVKRDKGVNVGATKGWSECLCSNSYIGTELNFPCSLDLISRGSIYILGSMAKVGVGQESDRLMRGECPGWNLMLDSRVLGCKGCC